MDDLPIEFLDSLPEDAARRLQAYLARLRKVRLLLGSFYCYFLEEEFTESERKMLANGMFPEVQEFVGMIAEALADKPDLFRHIPVDPELLLLQQQVADVLRGIRYHFQRLERLCGDTFLAVQADTAADAKLVVTRVRQEGELVCNTDPDLPDRQLALAAASRFQPRKGRYAKKQGRTRRSKRAR